MRRSWSLAGGVLIAVGLGWWVLQVTVMTPADRGNAASYGQFVLAAVGLLIIVGGWVVKAFTSDREPDLDELTDQLALAMRRQWTRAARERRLLHPAPLPVRWRRSVAPVAGPAAAALAHTLLDPLPGADRLTSDSLSGGTLRDLHRIYAGLPSGRMLIIGGPGAGKSSTAVLLLLDALRYRDQTAPGDRPAVPVPVLFTLQGWDPASSSVEDWLRTKLVEVPLFRGRHGPERAIALLRAGRIAVFLDGLDEIAEANRPTALQALSEQADFRLVLLTRTAELVTAVQQHGLTSAVALELEPLMPSDVADYLLNPLTEPAPSPWQRLAHALTRDPASPAAQALTTPLAVGLVRDVYPPDAAVDELLDAARFPRPEDVTNHLLDHAISAAYTPRPGQPSPRYTVETARDTLAFVARRLNHQQTRDLTWWTIHTWTPRVFRLLVSATILSVMLAAGIWLVTRFGWGLLVGLVGVLLIVIVDKYVLNDTPIKLAPFKGRHILTPEFVIGVVFGLIGGIVLGIFSMMMELSVAPPAVLGGGIATGFLIGLWMSVTTDVTSTDSGNPVDVWRGDLLAKIVGSLPLTCALGFLIVVEPVLAGGLPAVLVYTVLISHAWAAGLAQVHLAIRYRMPVRLIRFLEDARSRHLLRTVGPVYQFRHATLQDRLAKRPSVGRRAGRDANGDGESVVDASVEVDGERGDGRRANRGKDSDQ